MTEAPCSAASMDAGSPEAPAPTTTTSATLSQCRVTPAAWAPSAPMPVRAVAPIPANAALTKSLLGRFVLVSVFFMLRSCIFDSDQKLFVSVDVDCCKQILASKRGELQIRYC